MSDDEASNDVPNVKIKTEPGEKGNAANAPHVGMIDLTADAFQDTDIPRHYVAWLPDLLEKAKLTPNDEAQPAKEATAATTATTTVTVMTTSTTVAATTAAAVTTTAAASVTTTATATTTTTSSDIVSVEEPTESGQVGISTSKIIIICINIFLSILCIFFILQKN